MSDFKVGAKVRNKVTGDVLEFAGYSDNKGVRYAKCRLKGVDCDMLEFYCCTYWKVEDCEPYFENEITLASDRLPNSEDADAKGHVLCKCFGKWESYLEEALPTEVMEAWTHTPDWTPLEPLLDSCKECENWGHVGKTYTTPVCWKHRIEASEPFYKGNTPCHLAGKDDV